MSIADPLFRVFLDVPGVKAFTRIWTGWAVLTYDDIVMRKGSQSKLRLQLTDIVLILYHKLRSQVAIDCTLVRQRIQSRSRIVTAVLCKGLPVTVNKYMAVLWIATSRYNDISILWACYNITNIEDSVVGTVCQVVNSVTVRFDTTTAIF